MLLLITDTSGKHGCVALARSPDRSDHVELIEEVPLAGGTFSAQLVPQIAALLSKHGYSKTEIGAFIVVSGPGSFTGLRVGLAAIKALAEILGKPIVPVSLLEVIARESGRNGSVLAALDAGRGEVYAGEYFVSDGVARRDREALLSREELSMADNGVLMTPDQGIATHTKSAVVVAFPNAKSIARLGRQKLDKNETVSPAELEANYIRRSDAEIFAKPAR